VKASDEKQSNTQCERADKQCNENGGDNSEFDRRGALPIKA
jgi:hypothetical protein